MLRAFWILASLDSEATIENLIPNQVVAENAYFTLMWSAKCLARACALREVSRMSSVRASKCPPLSACL